MSDTPVCAACRLPVGEVCPDGYCRPCHVSLTFEACVDGSWTRAIRAAFGFPVPEAERDD